MALCWFGKCQDCQNNCKGWFAGDAALIDGCKKRCAATKGDSPTSRDDYMNQIGVGSVQQAEQQAQDEKSSQQTNETLKTVGKIAAFLALIFFLIIVIKKVNK